MQCIETGEWEIRKLRTHEEYSYIYLNRDKRKESTGVLKDNA